MNYERAGVAVLGLVILGAVSYGLAQLVGWLLTMTLLIGLAMGATFVPFLIRFLGPSLPLGGMFGLGTMILAQLANGATCAYVRSSDDIDLCPYDPEENHARIDGEWVALDDDVTVYRVAWRPFVISWEKDEQSLREYAVEDPDVRVRSDDGTALLADQANGTSLWAPLADRADAITIDVLRWIRDMGREGNQLLNRTEEIAMRDYSGDRGLGQLALGILLVGAFFGTFIVTYLMMSVL